MIERIAICDDEKIDREEIENYLRDYYEEIGKQVIIDIYDSVEELEEIWQRERKEQGKDNVYDLYILDIIMSGKTGIEFMRMLEMEDDKGYIIFVTNYDSYMHEAYGKNVCGYVEKPLNDDNEIMFRKRLDWIQECAKRQKKVTVTMAGVTIPEVTFKLEEIVKICSIRHGTRVLLMSGEEIEVRRGLNVWERELRRDCFVRISRFNIINMKYVRRIGKKIVMKNGEELALTRDKVQRDIIKRRYFEYKETKIALI